MRVPTALMKSVAGRDREGMINDGVSVIAETAVWGLLTYFSNIRQDRLGFNVLIRVSQTLHSILACIYAFIQYFIHHLLFYYTQCF